MAPVLLLLAPLACADSAESGPPEGAILAPVGNTAADIRATLELPAATWYNDADADKIFDSLEQRFNQAPARAQPAIVTFVEGTDVTAALAAAQLALGDWSPRHVYHHTGGFAADLMAQDAHALAALHQVRQIEWSQPGHPELDTATETMGVRAVQDLIQPVGAPGIGIAGEGVVVAIMDSGFDGQHVDLAGQFVRFIDWANGGREGTPYDSGSHGTHVASIAVGLGAGNPDYKGVAPGAKAVGFRINNGDTKAAAIASVDWILAHPEAGVRVSTISYGFGTTVDGTDALELAMDRLWEAGVVPFKSAGNEGSEKRTLTIPGGARGILAVGAIHDPGEDGLRMRESSSRGPTDDGRIKPDIVAPGSSIMAASKGTGDRYRSSSGTSMASPFAAGVAALMISADPGLTTEDVRRILEDTAWDMGPAGADIDWGAGRIDALRAVQRTLLERALSEQLPWGDVAAWNVTGPPLLGHQFFGFSGPSAAASFTVVAADQPLGITILADGLEMGSSPGSRAVTVVVEDPNGAQAINSPFLSTNRQQSYSTDSAMAGTYHIRVNGLEGLAGVNVDVVGFVPLAGNPYVLPADADAYEALGGPGAGGAAAPAGAVAFAGLTALFVVRPRRQ